MSDGDNKIEKIQNQLDEHKKRIDRHETIISKLDDDVKEIKGMLGQVATKDDVHEITEHVDKQFNELLRDALNAIPAKHANIIAILILLVAFVSLAHEFHWFGH